LCVAGRVHQFGLWLKMDKCLFIDKIGLFNLTVRISLLMIDRLRQLAIFSAVMDHGSFRGAARQLRLSPSVVSHHISQLEEHLGVALIYRSTRKLALTREGERLLAAAHNMLEAVEGEILALSTSARQPSGELRLTAPSVLSRSPFTIAMAEFAKVYPRIGLFLDFSDARRELIEDRFDIAIRMGFGGKNSATSRVLFSVSRKLVASAGYLADRPQVISPAQVDSWDWLAFAPVQGIPQRFAHKAEGTTTIKPQARLATNDAQALYRLARSGAGLAIVPDYLAAADVDAGIMQYVLPDWEPDPLNVFAEWPANAPRTGLVRLLLDWLSKTVNRSADASSRPS
jgi:DNA-binding transcriptional LysR family regulator